MNHRPLEVPEHERTDVVEGCTNSARESPVAQLLTPQQVAQRLQVTPEQVRSLIRSGRLMAVNVGAGPKRPCYRISQRDLGDFLERRSGFVPSVRKRPRRSIPRVPDFFPGLR